ASIGSTTAGQSAGPAGATTSPASSPVPAQRPGTAAQKLVPRRLTVTGTVKDYVAVTDAMLKNPDAGDWLMVHRTYQAWSHSPLKQITRDNVRHLELKWIWAMNDEGRNQPTPMVHGGVIYLANIGNIVQALDGKTGDLIWEHQLGGLPSTFQSVT